MRDRDRYPWKLEQARLLWARGQTDLAVRMAVAVSQALQDGVEDAVWSRDLLAEALQLAGGWMAAARTEGTLNIIDHYLRPAVAKASTVRRSAHLTLASFLADLYHRRKERLKGPEWTRKIALLEDR